MKTVRCLLGALCCMGFAHAQFVKWASFAPFSGPGFENGLRVCRASDGGYFVASGVGSGPQISHLDASGALLWTKNFPDSFEDMKVSGASLVLLTGDDRLISLRKLDNGGNLLWRSTYAAFLFVGATWNGGGQPLLDIDPLGNITAVFNVFEIPVIVFGANSGVCTNVQILHYSPGGTLLWSRIFGLPGLEEIARSMATDASGGLWIAGDRQKGYLGSSVFLTRYDINGNQWWSKTFDSTPTDQTTNNFANALTTDSNNHCFVAIQPAPIGGTPTIVQEYGPGGGLWHQVTLPHPSVVSELKVTPDNQITGLASFLGRANLFKISAARALRWYSVVAGSHAPTAYASATYRKLDIDSAGNSYVSFSLFTLPSPDAAVTKFSDSGSAQWTEREDGDKHVEDSGDGLVFDPAGRVISIGTVDSGAVDDTDVRVTALKPDGTLLWHAQKDAGLESRWLNSYVAAPDGSTYYASENFTEVDIIPGVGRGFNNTIRRVNPDGTLGWQFTGPTKILNTDGTTALGGSAGLVGTPDGGVTAIFGFFVPGTTKSTELFEHFGPGGTMKWNVRLDGGLICLAHDPTGNLYVALRQGNNAPLLTKLTSMGIVAWTTTTTLVDQLVWDPLTGGLYGAHQRFDSFNDIQLEKINPTGTPAWTETIGKTFGVADNWENAKLSVSPDGHAVVTALTYSGTSSTVFEQAFDGTGGRTWSTSLEAPVAGGQGSYGVKDVTIDPAGNQYVLEYFATVLLADPTSYSRLVKISPSGQVLWTMKLPAFFTRVLLSNGYVFACGSNYRTATQWDLAVCKISANGALLWPASGQGVQNGIALYDAGFNDSEASFGGSGLDGEFLSSALASFSADLHGGIYAFGMFDAPVGVPTAAVVKFSDP